MSKLSTILTGLGLGAGLMYFYDPRRGRRRRALARDQFNGVVNRADDAIDVAIRDLRNRTRGILAELMARVSNEGAPGWVLEERVRAELGRQVRHSSAIQVTADGDRIVLAGPILARELDRALRRAGAVRGVRRVENQLEVHPDPGNIPGLQGSQTRLEPVPEHMQMNWSPAMRVIGGLGGGLLAVWGMGRGGLIGALLKIAGLGLVARGVTNLDLRRMLGFGDARDAIGLQKAINLNTPIDEVYRFWQNFENFPRFMAHLKEVRNLGNGLSYWVAAGPPGMDVEWEARITQELPNERIEWESVEGAPLKTRGMVHFTETRPDQTRVTVDMHYTPPAGVLGHAIATLMGTDPKKAMDEDLARLKTLLEEGKTSVEGQTIMRQDLGMAGST
jgi:uncharacterized membrane protein